MNADEPGNTPIRDRILEAVLVGKSSPQVAVGDHEDVFAKFGLNSLETFQVLVRLEKMFDIVIGEDPAEFDRIRTLGGFSELVTEKVRENALDPGLSGAPRVMDSTLTVDRSTPVIEEFPRIDRYFPQCLIAGIEASSRFLFGVSDFGKIYGKHTFVYRRPPGPIEFRANGVELDLEIHRVVLTKIEVELALRIEDVFGIRTTETHLATCDAYLEFCQERFRQRVPVVSNFDLRFIKARREYEKVSLPHVIVLHGFDQQRQQFRADEQMLGPIVVEMSDLLGGVAQSMAQFGAMAVWELSRLRDTERQLERAEVSAQIETNIQNLEAADPLLGLNALSNFSQDLTGYVRGDSFHKKPFAIPGLWVFSHERHIERKWLSAVRPLFPEHSSALFAEFDELLLKLFNRWLSTDYLLEKCLASESPRALRGLPNYLAEILIDEKAALEKWKQLHALIRAN